MASQASCLEEIESGHSQENVRSRKNVMGEMLKTMPGILLKNYLLQAKYREYFQSSEQLDNFVLHHLSHE